MAKKPLILISNDDGYQAKGLKVLIEAARPFGRLLVVAPDKGESGMSHAISIKHPLRLTKQHEEQDLSIYSINGTPVDAVKIALNQIVDEKPALLLSGVNHGSNASISVIYSGTLGAAREGCLNGVPSVGFSLLNHDKDADFSMLEGYLPQMIKQALEHGLADQTFLNINFPDVKTNEIKGVKVCRKTKGVWKEEYEKRVDPHGGEYYWLTGSFNNFEPNADDTDEWALARNYIAVVPTQIDTTSYQELENIRKWDWYGK
ncbi:MAG: 5'/3'-nucleotidase SurE [Bacteroidales bacterium]|nr:5'/3'-nucleotidase SurE [Bacteroidales bacterium]